MGRIKTQLIKRVSFEIYERHPDAFNTDFGQNNKKISQFAEFRSKKVRNSISGYITRLVKAKVNVR